jgi:lysophospholipase L1-like esterase
VDDSTLRITVVSSLDGEALRVAVSNEYGTDALRIGRAAVRIGARSFPLHFAGAPAAAVPAGGELLSDPATARIAAGAPIEVDLYLPGPQTLTTGNFSAAAWVPSAPGDHCGSGAFPETAPPQLTLPDGSALPAPTPILRSVEVSAMDAVPVVVCLGDSITAAGWPERAAARLHESVGVANRGVPGNRLRFGGAGPMGAFFGPAGVERFDHDVLDTVGRTHVVIALGTNDLGHPGQHAPESELPTAEELIGALDATAARARSAGLGVFFATITPFLPAAGYDEARERIRVEANDWMRRQGDRAGVIDFDAALRDDRTPARLATVYNSGDHLHPSTAGLDRMAEEAAQVITRTLELHIQK